MSRMSKRPTLRTISEVTGLSQSTVSLALRGGQSLKPETYRLVTEAAQRLGYVPNSAGVRLRTGKTNVIALVLQRTDETIDYARYLIQGVGHAINSTQYHLNVVPEFGSDSGLDSIRYILNNRTADGVIITHTTANDPRVQLLTEAKFPFVTHGRTGGQMRHAFCDYHSEEFVRIAVARMVERKRRRVMLIAGPNNTENYTIIEQTFRHLAREFGIDARVVEPPPGRPTLKAGWEFGREIARMEPRPDGVICDNELRSMFIVAGLGDEGVATGRDIHFICKQTSDILPAFYPQIDTIEEDVQSAGVELAQLLLRQIAGEAPETLQVLSNPKPHWRS